MTASAEALLDTWFGDELDAPEVVDARTRLWFASDAAFDASLRQRFGDLPERAARGDLAGWNEAPRSALALVLALDQLPRNLFRGSARAFAYDAAAVEATLRALERGFDRRLHPVMASFLYLPLEHAEDAGLQARGVALYRELLARAPTALSSQFEQYLAFAERHRAVVDRFGRFPHRNAVLGRTATPEEERYLAEGGETFSAPEGAE